MSIELIMSQNLEILIKPERTTMGITITPTRVSLKFRSEEEKMQYIDSFKRFVRVFLEKNPNVADSYRARFDLEHLAKYNIGLDGGPTFFRKRDKTRHKFDSKILPTKR